MMGEGAEIRTRSPVTAPSIPSPSFRALFPRAQAIPRPLVSAPGPSSRSPPGAPLCPGQPRSLPPLPPSPSLPHSQPPPAAPRPSPRAPAPARPPGRSQGRHSREARQGALRGPRLRAAAGGGGRGGGGGGRRGGGEPSARGSERRDRRRGSSAQLRASPGGGRERASSPRRRLAIRRHPAAPAPDRRPTAIARPGRASGTRPGGPGPGPGRGGGGAKMEAARPGRALSPAAAAGGLAALPDLCPRARQGSAPAAAAASFPPGAGLRGWEAAGPGGGGPGRARHCCGGAARPQSRAGPRGRTPPSGLAR